MTSCTCNIDPPNELFCHVHRDAPFSGTPKPALEEMDRLVADWVNSPQGQRELAATQRDARAAADKVLRDAVVTSEQLREPCTL